MTALVTLANLADIDHAVNGLGQVGGEMVRDRWNQRATVIVTDHPADPGSGPDSERALFTNRSLHNAWRLGNAKLGTAIVNDSGGDVDGQDIVIPVSQTLGLAAAGAEQDTPAPKTTKKGSRNGSVTTATKKAA